MHYRPDKMQIVNSNDIHAGQIIWIFRQGDWMFLTNIIVMKHMVDLGE